MALKYYEPQIWRCDNSENDDSDDETICKDTGGAFRPFQPRDEYCEGVREIQLNESDVAPPAGTFCIEERDTNDSQQSSCENLKSCASCSKPRRVENVSSFKTGQHICMAGEHSNKYFKQRRKLKNAYTHHAIIKEIKQRHDTSAELVLIHFTKKNGKIKIFETSEVYDLKEKEIYVVEYTHPRYDPETIVKRAKSILEDEKKEKFKNYNILLNNCEHFATWCVVGESESFQVQGIRDKIAVAVRQLLGTGSKIAKGIVRLLLNFADEMAQSAGRFAPDIVLGVTTGLYLIYCVVMTVLHIKNYKNGKMCWSCLKGKLQDLWLAFGVFGITSLITSLVFHFVIPLLAPQIGIPITCFFICLSVALQLGIPKIRSTLQGPFRVEKEKIDCLSKINIGDVISYHSSTMIVTEVDTSKGSFSAVYYGRSFLTKQIVEKQFSVDLTKDKLYLFDCKKLKTYLPESVVERARSRIGERKWSLFSNRSDHFCYWAKVQDDLSNTDRELNDNSDVNLDINLDVDSNENQSDVLNENLNLHNGTVKSTLFIEEREVHSLDDIRVGDVVKGFKIGFLRDCGIVVDIKQDGNKRIFKLDVCTYAFLRTVRLRTLEINLNSNRIYVKKYHSAQCHRMETRAENARRLINKNGPWWTSSGFIRGCIMLNP